MKSQSDAVKSFCPRCGHELVRETELDYPWLCEECDENFYDFEVIKGKDELK